MQGSEGEIAEGSHESLVQTLLSLQVIGEPGTQPSMGSHVSIPLHWLPSSQGEQRRRDPDWVLLASSGGTVLHAASPSPALKPPTCSTLFGVKSLLYVSILTSNENVQKFGVSAGMRMGEMG